MKFFISIVLIAMLSLAACLYLPWWSIAVAAFIVAAMVPLKPLKAFFAGFIPEGKIILGSFSDISFC